LRQKAFIFAFKIVHNDACHINYTPAIRSQKLAYGYDIR